MGACGRDYEQEYCEYLMSNSEQVICNGDALIEAMERGDLLNEFCAFAGISIEQFEGYALNKN